MDFEDTPEEAAYRAQVRGWLEANALSIPPGTRVGVTESKAWQKVKAAAGYAAITWPKEYGGMGGTSMQNVIYGQEESQYNLPGNVFLIGLGMAMPMLMVHGTPEQRERYIRPALYGEEIWCQLFSEPGAGSDLAGVRSRAERDGNDWIINGQKIWTSGAHYSDFGILVVRTDPTVPKHKGLSFFLVDMKSPGIRVERIRQISGQSHFNEVFLENVRIPDSMRVGAVGDGWKVALTVLMNERSAVGNMGAGLGIDEMIQLARDTELGDGPAIRNAAVREKIADWHVQSQGLKYTRFRSLTALSKGTTPGPENSIAKLVSAPRRQDLSAFAIEMMDMGGIIRDRTISPYRASYEEDWLSSPGIRIAGGTDEILRNIIAERVLKLPGDVRVDSDVPFNELPTGR
ncbi:MAG TPA: acyl-CoA dehydrogenase family protein [Alphaproteobacteria bacterium]|nr:acyl-CoA dehydrogenase family protein [Alphaproteobacteria bacterium]